jgi:3'5'-cyclic nucleotide phosphodiesterase
MLFDLSCSNAFDSLSIFLLIQIKVHNFEHASHVTMSSIKLLSRIIAPSDHYTEGVTPNKDDASSLHDHTYGITSDPLTQFSCVLSALIHDLDHPGMFSLI